MTNDLKMRQLLENIASGNGTPVEKFLLKKFGEKEGIRLIKLISGSELKYDNYKVKFLKAVNDNSKDYPYYIQLIDLKDNEQGMINYNIFPEDPRYIRMAFKENHVKDDMNTTLNTMLQFVDEIAMKIEAKVIDVPYPVKNEIAIYRQHKYEPFTDHPTEKSDYIYNKYDIRHCKTNILGLFDIENENA